MPFAMKRVPTEIELHSAASRRRRALGLSAAVAGLTIAWLALTADKQSGGVHQFFGLWRMRHILVAVAGIWLTVAALAATVSRKALWRMLATTISAALTILLIEVVALTGIIDIARVLRGKEMNPYGIERPVHIDVSGETYQDIWMRWGIDSQPIPFQFKTDARGFRNEEDRDAADIYLLGDSFLVAGLVPFEQTITHLLEAATRRPLMNISLIALSVQNERDLLTELKLPMQRRLVIHFVFEGNDLADSAAYRTTGSSVGRRVPALTRRDRSPTYQFLMALQRGTQAVDPAFSKQTGIIGDETYGFVYVGPHVGEHDEEIPHVLAALDDTRRYVEERGGIYAVVVIPEKFRVLGPLCRWPEGSDLADEQRNLSPLLPAVVHWGAERGVATLDLTASLQESARAGRIPWFPGDTHWNEHGHAAAADAFAAWIASQDWKLGANDSQ